MNGEGPKALYLRADAAGVITSGQIEADSDVEILDPNVYICTISEGGRIDMEMRLKRGRGYVSADKNFDSDLGIGFIPVDSVHSPVRKVNYLVEAARLGPDHRLREADAGDLDERYRASCRRVGTFGEAAEGTT